MKRLMLFSMLSGIIGAVGISGFIGIVIWSGIESWTLIVKLLIKFCWRVFKFVLLLALVYIAIVMYCCL